MKVLFFVTLGLIIPHSYGHVEDYEKPVGYYTEHDHEDEGTIFHVPLRLKSDNCADTSSSEEQFLSEMIDELGGRQVDIENYDHSVVGLDQYLEDSGVSREYNAPRMVSPYNPGVAKQCGLKNLFPKKCRWKNGAVQGLIADEFSRLSSNPIFFRNWYRPKCYNSNVGGASASDHLQARAFDLDFKTPDERAKAQKFLCDLYKKRGKMNLQVGIGCITIHLGVGSTKRSSSFPAGDGSRFWTYSSLRNCPIKRITGDDCWRITSRGKLYVHTTIPSRGAL